MPMNYLDFLSAVQELYQRMLSPICDEFGLSSMELIILMFLSNNPEYDTAAEIVRKRHLAKSHVSTSVRSLEEKGLLLKEHRNGNHRSDHLVLREKSSVIIKKGQAAQNHFFKLLSDGISDKQKKEMLSGFETMNENVQCALREDIK